MPMDAFARDLSIGALIVVVVYFLVKRGMDLIEKWIECSSKPRTHMRCADSLDGTLKELIQEMKSEQDARREAYDKQSEAFTGMIVTLTSMCGLMKETLERVRDTEKAVNTIERRKD